MGITTNTNGLVTMARDIMDKFDEIAEGCDCTSYSFQKPTEAIALDWQSGMVVKSTYFA